MSRSAKGSSHASSRPSKHGSGIVSTRPHEERAGSDSDRNQLGRTQTSSSSLESTYSGQIEDTLEDCIQGEQNGAEQNPNQSFVTMAHSTNRPSHAVGIIADATPEYGEGIQGSEPRSTSIHGVKLDTRIESTECDKETGFTFENLVDRLLSQPSTKTDVKFMMVFLCLYRKFASPHALLMAIIRRFEDTDKIDLTPSDYSTTRLRYLNVLKDWVSNYPGDFAHPLSRRLLNGFMQSLTASQTYSLVSREINTHLEMICEDDDTEWACSDEVRSRANTMDSFLTMSSTQSASSVQNADSPTLTDDSSTEDVTYKVSPDKLTTSKGSRTSATPSLISNISQSDSQSANSLQTLLNVVENAQRQAQLLAPVPRNILTKVHWHQLMELPDETISREMTRIDWVMFLAIRPRDLIRHVLLQSEQREKCTSLEHVNRMICHFNHIAFWVTNMILLRDKPKHRARILEKFMGIAWKLRHLNNYNSLGAVIAGINGTAIHRLAQTREMVSPEAQKQFMRLEILMGTQKSHFAYRLAFGNTTSSRIPFLPLHRRDLILAEQGNATYVNVEKPERINWKKFEIMGEVIVTIRSSQEVGYASTTRSEEVQRLILEGRFCKDDDVRFLLPEL